MEGAGHMDLYDQFVGPAVETLSQFFDGNLAQAATARDRSSTIAAG
jgi:hypothetical protein